MLYCRCSLRPLPLFQDACSTLKFTRLCSVRTGIGIAAASALLVSIPILDARLQNLTLGSPSTSIPTDSSHASRIQHGKVYHQSHPTLAAVFSINKIASNEQFLRQLCLHLVAAQLVHQPQRKSLLTNATKYSSDISWHQRGTCLVCHHSTRHA